MGELQLENKKKDEVVGKADSNKEQATKEQAENKNMMLNKDGGKIRTLNQSEK